MDELNGFLKLFWVGECLLCEKLGRSEDQGEVCEGLGYWWCKYWGCDVEVVLLVWGFKLAEGYYW